MAETLANGTVIPQGSDPIHTSGVQWGRNMGGSIDGQLGNRYTKAQADALLAGKAPATHTHDDRYYTETEMDTKLAGKSGTDEVATLQAQIAALAYKSGRIDITSRLDPAPVSGTLHIERRGGTVWLHMDGLVLTATGFSEMVFYNVIPSGFQIVAPAEIPTAPRLQDQTRDVQTNIRTYSHVFAVYRVEAGAALRGMVSWPTNQAIPAP